MTHDRDIERLLDVWFADGPGQVADRVIDGTADRIAHHRQLPAWRLRSWRFPSMSTPIRLLAVGAALLAVLVGGAVFLGGGAGPGPSPTLSPTPSPTPAESPSAVFPSWYSTDEITAAAGILPVGAATTRAFQPGFTFTVPDGWVNDADHNDYYTMFPDTAANQAEFAASGGLADEMAVAPVASPYFYCDAWEDNSGATAAEVVAAIGANDAVASSEPIDVTIGGLTGKQIDVRLDPSWTETCPGDPPGTDLKDMRTRAILLDSPDRGILVIFLSSQHSADHEAFLAEAMPIVESFQFEVAP